MVFVQAKSFRKASVKCKNTSMSAITLLVSLDLSVDLICLLKDLVWWFAHILPHMAHVATETSVLQCSFLYVLEQ